jgi:hypothetical protein
MSTPTVRKWVACCAFDGIERMANAAQRKATNARRSGSTAASLQKGLENRGLMIALSGVPSIYPDYSSRGGDKAAFCRILPRVALLLLQQRTNMMSDVI